MISLLSDLILFVSNRRNPLSTIHQEEEEFNESGPYYLHQFAPLFSLENKRILEIGCGYGGICARIANDVMIDNIIGIDLDSQFVQRACVFAQRKKVAKEQLHFSVQDASNIAFKESTFDVALSLQTFEHFSLPEKVLEEAYRVLKPTGLFVIIFPPYYSPMGAHVFDLINIPWMSIFPDKVIVETWLEARKRHPEKEHFDYIITPIDQRKHAITGLNRMTIRRFNQILRYSPFKIRYYEEKKIKFHKLYLKPLNWLGTFPILKEGLTYSVYCILEK